MAINTDIRRAMDIGGYKGAIATRTEHKAGAMEKRIDAPVDQKYDPRAGPNTLASNQEELQAWQDTPEKTGLGQIGSTETIIKLGLAAAAAIFGGSGGQQIGAGFAAGALGGASKDAEDYNFKRQKRIDDLTNLVDRQQQRLSTIVTQYPEGMVDEDGNNIVPSDTVQDLLALNVPFSSAALLANITEGKEDMRRYSTAEGLITLGISTKNPGPVIEGLTIINEIGDHGWSEARIKEMARANPSQIIQMLSEDNEPASVIAAANWAYEHDTTILTPGATRLLSKKLDEGEWNIDSIDDQIKVDAYKALKWFNDVWMNDEVDGVRNRERYKNNPEEAIKQAFEGNVDELIAIKKIFPSTQLGDDLAKIRTNAVIATASILPQIQMFMSGALTGTDAEKLEAIVKLAKSFEDMANAANGAVTLDNRASMGPQAGARYVSKHEELQGMNQAEVAAIGADIISIAAKLALEAGVDNFFMADFPTRMKYQNLAELMYDDYRKGGDIDIPVIDGKDTGTGTGDTAPDLTAAEELLDTTPEEEVVVTENVIAPVSMVTELAGDRKRQTEMHDKASNLYDNVVKTPKQEQAMENFELFMELPDDKQLAYVDDPVFAEAIGVVAAMAQHGISMSGAVALVADETEMRGLLKELNAEENITRKAKMLRIPRYAKAHEWEAAMRRISPATLKVARERQAKVEKLQNMGRSRRH